MADERGSSSLIAPAGRRPGDPVRGRFRPLALLSAIILAACTSPPQPPPQPEEPVAIVVPDSERLVIARTAPVAPAALDVAVIDFDSLRLTSFEDTATSFLANPKLRDAENRYLPYLLRSTLEASGQWASVRVLPDVDPSAELNIAANILVSDGVRLALHVRAWDSTGRTWLDERYYTVSRSDEHEFESAEAVARLNDPFDNLYRRVANDLLRVREALERELLTEIVRVARLRYAISLAPEAFEPYIAVTDDGRIHVQRLPAEGDAVMQRVDAIREREYELKSLIDHHYGAFARSIGHNYSLWRKFSFELLADNRRLVTAAANARGRVGEVRVLRNSYEIYQSHKLNELALQEITESFETSTATTVMELEGRVYRLNGTLAEQYEKWRRLLRQLYAEELGERLN